MRNNDVDFTFRSQNDAKKKKRNVKFILSTPPKWAKVQNRNCPDIDVVPSIWVLSRRLLQCDTYCRQKTASVSERHGSTVIVCVCVRWTKKCRRIILSIWIWFLLLEHTHVICHDSSLTPPIRRNTCDKNFVHDRDMPCEYSVCKIILV